ncbi:MAG TPA: hypothetical protein VFM70_04125, partial [Salinimicrobium sp.]|nr:hypothetical protein [Salinimicrobium sp.]
DYKFMQKIFSHFPYQTLPSLFQVFELLDKHPEYLKIHGHKKQANVDAETLKRIDSFYRENQVSILETKKEIYNDHR